MTSTLTYLPDKGFTINDRFLSWGLDRTIVREMLGGNFKDSDHTTDLSNYHNGNHEFDIIQRRDIYKNYNDCNNFFFLKYNSEHSLMELEISDGFIIEIHDTKIRFNITIAEAVLSLRTLSDKYTELSEGEYLFADLKLVVASSEAMGGGGDTVSYFYCSSDITHLLGS